MVREITRKLYILIGLFLFTHSIEAQRLNSSSSETFRLSSDPIGEFNCTEPIEFNNPFTIRRASWAASDEVNTFATPIVGDVIPGNGKVEILVLAKTESYGRDPWGNNEWTWAPSRPVGEQQYVTRNIIVYTYDSDGAGGLVKKAVIPTPDLNFEGPTPFAIANIPGYPKPLVIVATSSTVSRSASDPLYAAEANLASRLIAYDVDSKDMFDYRWISTSKYGANVPDGPMPGIKYRSGGSVGVAQFNLGGGQFPQVYIFNEIFSLDPSLANNKIFSGGSNLGQGINSITPGGTSSYGGSQSVVVAADVIPNNNMLELVCGNTVYELDNNFNLVNTIRLQTMMANGEMTPDGFTSVANIDQSNGRLDIVVTTKRFNTPNSRLVYVWTIRPDRTPQLIAQRTLTDASEESLTFHNARVNTGLAFIGDIDGNTQSEIGVTSPLRLWMLSYNGTPILQDKWAPLVTNDESGHTLITMFDFNQDGSQELVYRDERLLRIIDGSGSDRVTIPVWGATAGEGPVIADVNLDGEADIIVTDSQTRNYDTDVSGNLNRYASDPHAKLVVFKSQPGNPWAPARSVWNQYAYFSFHVNDNLTIPAPQLNHGLEMGEYFPTYDANGCLIADRRPFNSFLVQRTFYTSDGCFSSGVPIMDAKIAWVKASFACDDGTGAKIDVELEVRNDGDADMPADTKIQFSINGTIIDEVTVGSIVSPSTSINLSKTISSSFSEGDLPPPIILSAVINPQDSNGVHQYKECIYDDPIEISVQNRASYTINSPGPQCFIDNLGNVSTFILTPQNIQANSEESSLLEWYLNDLNSAPISTGGIYQLDPNNFSLTINGLNPGQYTFYLKNGCNNEIASIQLEVFPNPSATFSSTAATCYGSESGKILVPNHQQGYVYYVSGTLYTGQNFNEVKYSDNTTLEAASFFAGSYTIRVVDESKGGCEVTEQVEVSQPDEINIIVLEELDPGCDASNGSVSFSLEGGLPGFNFTLVNKSTNQQLSNPVEDQGNGVFVIKNLAGGEYELLVIDSNNCEKRQQFVLTSQQSPSFNYPTDLEICEGDEVSASIQIVDLGNPPATPTYIWGTISGGNFSPLSNGQSVAGGIIEISSDGLTATFKGLSPNTAGHEFAVRVENACDQPDSPFIIIVNPTPKVDISTTDITCFGGDDGVIQVTKSSAADASEVYEYTLTETGEINSTGTFSGLSFQTNPYTILVRNTATQCFEYVTAELLQPEKVEFENVVLTESTCGTDNGEISGSVRGGKGPFDVFLIVGGNKIDTLNTSDSFQFTGLAAGSYFIQAMDTAGCLSDIFDAVIANDDKAALEINLSDIETCEGETVEIIPQINSQGLPRTVSWYKDEQKNQLISNGPDSDDPTVSYSLVGENLIISGLKSGSNVTYYVDVTGDDFCPIDPEPVSIVVTPPLEIDLVYDQEICFGEGVSVTANATGGNGQFEFSLDGGAFQTNNIFENVSAGEHTLVIRTNQGCSISETFTVIGPSSPLEINDDPVVISSSCDLENGEISNIQVIGGYGNYTIEWRFNDPNSAPIASNVLSLTDLAPGTYYLSITDEGGCNLLESFEISELPGPKIAITEEEVCIGEDVILIPVQTVSGAAPTGLTWYLDAAGTILINEGPDPNDSNINYSIGDSLELTVSGLPIGDYSFFLKIECTGELVEAKAKVNSLPAPEFEITNVLCFGETTGKLQVSAGSDPNFTYVVNGGSPLTQGQLESQSFPAGNYTIMISNSQTGCFSEQELEITQPEELIYTKGSFQNPTCGDSNGTLTFTVEGGVGPYSVEINNKPINEFNFSENQGLFSLANLSPGSYSIAIRDSNNCLIDLPNEFTLINNEGTEIQLEPLEDFICEGNSAVLSPQITTASGNFPEIRWYLNSSLTQQISSNFDPNGSGVMYQIDAQSGALTVFNLPAGEHKYYIQLSGAEFCTISEEAIIEVSPAISAEVEIIDVTCFGEANGKILITNIQGGNPPLEFSINGGAWQDNPLFENLSPGNYSVSVRDKTGDFDCEFILEDIIVEGPDGPISIGPDVIIQRASCGLSNGSISNIEISGGWGNYQIEWRKDSPTGAILNSGNEQGISNLSPGKYFLTITDSGNCSEVFDFEITEQNDPLYSPVAITDICEGENISLEAINTVSDAASSSFIWSKGPNKTNPISEGNDPAISGVTYQFTEVNTTLGLEISGLPAGSYTYYLFIECTSQEIEFEFEVKASPSPTFQQNNISCFGVADGKIQVVSGGETDFEYSINGAAPITQTALNALNFGPGDYNIVVTNSIGCNSQTYNFQIQEPEELIIVDVQTKNSACGSGDGYIDIAWTGGTAAFVVSLLENGSVLSTSNTSDNDIRFDNLSPGDYDIVITDASNCQVSSTGVLSITDGPSEILADDLVICEGEIAVIDPEVNPSNSNAIFSWYWNSISPSNLLSDGSTRGGVTISIDANGSIQLDGLAGGSTQVLFVTVAGEGICEGDQKRVEIKVDRAPEVTFTKKDEQCFGEGGEIHFTAADISQLEFSLNGGAFTKYPNGLISGLAPGSYLVSVRNSSGCLTEITNPIEVLGPSGKLEFVDFTISPSSCNSQDGQITSELRGGTAPYTIRLLNGSGTLLSSQNLNNPGNFTISGLAAGDYQVEVIDANQCILRSDAINLADEPTSITIQDVTICQGEVAVLSATFSQSVSPISYEWYYDKDLTRRVNLNAAPDEYGATYSSSNPNSLSISSLPARSNPYSYFVMVTGPGVCPPQPKEVKVSVRPLPTLKVSNPSIVCDPNQSVDLTKFIEGYNPNVFDYVIVSPTGAPLRLDQISSVKTNGSYTVQAGFKGANCFTPIEKIAVVIATTELVADFDYQIELPGNPPIVNSDVQALEEVKFMDNSQGDAIIWNWDFGDGTTSTQRNPTHQYQEAGQFLVKLTTVDSFGCISEVQRIIEVFDDYIIIIPNAFTPDGAKNQYFIPKHRGIASMEFYIFTTWGELIFETNSLESKGWDGTFKGKPALNGNYVYRAKFVTRTGTEVDRSGVFVLIR